MTRGILPLLLLLPLLGVQSRPARAQARLSVEIGAGFRQAATRPQGKEGRALLASALLPGLGQQRLGTRRWIAYAVVEAGGWAYLLERRGEGRQLERRYRDLAWTVARGASAGPRRDGDFHYYETLGKFTASGAYDAEPGTPALHPERDETTYNGSLWALARAMYFPADGEEPAPGALEYERALAYYREHAVTEAYAWSWEGRLEERETYRKLIHSSDEAMRASTRALGVILANHLVSAVDAWVTARLQATRSGAAPLSLFSGIEGRGGGSEWRAGVRVTIPRT